MTVEPDTTSAAKPEKGVAFSRLHSLVAWIFVAGLLAIVGIQLYNARLAQPGSGPAPDFELTTFDGETIRLSDLRGNVVVVNFWASWCIPCREEAPVLENAWQEFKELGVIFIGVDYLDTEREALAFISEFGITYFNGPDTGTRIGQAYRVRGVPETFFIDGEGQIRDVFIGPLTESELRQRIQSLLTNW